MPEDSVPVEQVINQLSFASTAIPEVSAPLLRIIAAHPTVRSKEGAESLAGTWREALGLDDLEPVPALSALLATRCGLIVVPLQVRGLVAGVARIGDLAVVFVPNQIPDCQFAVGYALARLCRLPAPIAGAPAVEFSFYYGLERSSPLGADWFSARVALGILVPSHGLGRAWRAVRRHLDVTNPAPGDVELLYLSRIFGVSFFALAKRCEHLELLPPEAAKAFEETLTTQCGGPDARAKELGLPAYSVRPVDDPSPLLLAAAVALLRAGGATPRALARHLGWREDVLNRVLRTTSPENSRTCTNGRPRMW